MVSVSLRRMTNLESIFSKYIPSLVIQEECLQYLFVMNFVLPHLASSNSQLQCGTDPPRLQSYIYMMKIRVLPADFIVTWGIGDIYHTLKFHIPLNCLFILNSHVITGPSGIVPGAVTKKCPSFFRIYQETPSHKNRTKHRKSEKTKGEYIVFVAFGFTRVSTGGVKFFFYPLSSLYYTSSQLSPT